VDLRQYLRVIRAHLLPIGASVAICTGIAAYLAWTHPPTYAAQIQLYVSSVPPGNHASSADSYAAILLSQQRAVSYTPLIASPDVVAAVNKQLRASFSPGDFQAMVTADRPDGTALINVTVTDRSPRLARAIASALGKQFPSYVEALETAKGAQNPSVRMVVASPAQLPTAPVAPRKTLYLVLGLLVGLVLGVGVAVLREALSRRIRTAEDVAATTGLPVLGSIARRTLRNGKPLVMVDNPSSAHAEDYRRVRTNLQALLGEERARSFVVSSANVSEGKTLVAANLGIAFAQAGHRVVLVDANLRRPMLAQVMGLRPTLGLTDVLADGVAADRALETWQEGLPLALLAAGPPTENPNDLLGSPREMLGSPSELLGSRWFIELLDELTAGGDVVIIDTPPLLPTTDAAIIARLTAGAVLVARSRSTRAHQLAGAVGSLHRVEARVLGVIINRLRPGVDTPQRGAEYTPVPDSSSEQRSPIDLPLRDLSERRANPN
jgi:capsular exopolysaccharide synthesis family protein